MRGQGTADRLTSESVRVGDGWSVCSSVVRVSMCRAAVFSVTGIAEMTINMIQLHQVDADENGHRPADPFLSATFVRHPCGASELER